MRGEPRASAAPPAGCRSSGPSPCSSPSTIRSAPAPSARASATSSATTRRWWCPIPRRSLADGAVEPWSHPSGRWYQKQLLKAAKKRGVDVDAPVRGAAPRDRRWVYDGGDGLHAASGASSRRSSRYRYKLHVRVFLSRYRSQSPCPRCARRAAAGPRRWPSRVGGAHHRRAEPARPSRSSPPSSTGCRSPRGRQAVARDVLRPPPRQALLPASAWASATSRSAARRARSRAARPSASIWPTSSAPSSSARSTCSTSRRSGCTRGTRRGWPSCAASWPHAGNTVVIVEHDRALHRGRRLPDRDGPGLGRARRRGRLRRHRRREFLKDPRSLTARYLSGRETIPLPLARRDGRRALVARAARARTTSRTSRSGSRSHTLTCVTGVSGSGKSTLVHDTLYRAVARALQGGVRGRRARTTSSRGLEHLKGVRLIDQEPIGRTPRSNPVTYVKAFDEIRKLFAGLPRAKTLGLGPGAFSFNVPGGRCEACQGDGFQKLEMYFVEDVYVTCQECEGRRYRSEVLQVTLQGPRHQPGAAADGGRGRGLLRGRSRCCSAGSRCSRRSASATSASASRPRRCRAARPSGSRSPPSSPRASTTDHLYILDEPTTGLHLDDVRKLLARPQPPGGRRQHGARRRAPPRRDQDAPTGSSTSGPRAARPAARSSPRARPSRSPRSAAPTPGKYPA